MTAWTPWAPTARYRRKEKTFPGNTGSRPASLTACWAVVCVQGLWLVQKKLLVLKSEVQPASLKESTMDLRCDTHGHLEAADHMAQWKPSQHHLSAAFIHSCARLFSSLRPSFLPYNMRAHSAVTSKSDLCQALRGSQRSVPAVIHGSAPAYHTVPIPPGPRPATHHRS